MDEALPGDGKVIYLSLGSLGCMDLGLMQRFIDVLDRTEQRVIVSMGPLHEQLRLGERMYGEQFLPQPSILPQCDLLITHGGNNTIAEAFHFGLPAIVAPLFWDQYDNAQRMHETGFGHRLPSYTFEDEELLGAVERLLADDAAGAAHGADQRRADRGARAGQGRGPDRAGRALRRCGARRVSFEDSLWHHTAGGPFTPRPSLPGDIDVDVAIVGAGYTGLWTAYYLHELDPSMRIAIVEREIAGFGASGRNGGWCSALFPPSSSGIARRHGREAAVATRRAMHESVVEVGRVAEAEGIDIDYARGGTVELARNEAQLARAREEVEEEHELTGGIEELELLSKDETEGLLRATRLLGGTYTPHCAAIHPLKLVRGLAARVEGRGVSIFERTAASEIRAGSVITEHGTVRAELVVRATEGYTPSLRGERRTLHPDLLADDRHRAAAAPRPGTRSACAAARRSGTCATCASTASARPTTASPSVAAARPTTSRSRTQPSFDRDRRVHSALREVLVRPLPRGRGLRGHPRVGRRARHPARLARVGGARS